ncbi:MAG: type III pantothenate kinase [Breznakibacter sp.]
MNLVIDQGNTLTKVALFDGEEMVSFRSMAVFGTAGLEALVRENSVDRAIFSSVSGSGDSDFGLLKMLIPQSMRLDTNTPLPFVNLYATPESLGKDRVAAVAGAIGRYPRENLLVIDAGTAITFELVTSDNRYVGGNIAPGMQMRFKALNQFTGKLPLYAPMDNVDTMGNTTQTAIVAGVQNSMVFEIEGYMQYLVRQYPGIKTILTGGDSEFFARNLKYPIFVHQNLVLEGLNRILKHNA